MILRQLLSLFSNLDGTDKHGQPTHIQKLLTDDIHSPVLPADKVTHPRYP